MGDSNSEPLEVWRGGVQAWECDHMGHMNVRFYVARAMEGLGAVSAALGMTDAFSAHALATLIVREHRIRFLREARVGAPLHMTAGVVSMGESDAVILQTLVHSLSGETCATFLTTVFHAAARDAKVFPWPARAHGLAAGLATATPREAQPRSIGAGPVGSMAGLAAADSLGLAVVGRGAVGAPDCDVFGRMRAEMVLHRVSMGIPHFVEPLRLAAQDSLPDVRVGGAALEYRIAYAVWPKAGDPVLLRSGFAEIHAKYARMVHWLLDPRTGGAYASAEHVGANFDLDARRILPMPPETLARMQTLVRPGLAI